MKTNHILLTGFIAALLLAAALPAKAQNNTNGNYFAGVGAHSAGPNYGANNTTLGWYVMYPGNANANNNTGVGTAALGNLSFGSDNAAVGYLALGLLNYTTTNDNNIALGSLAGYYLTAGANNIYIGNVGGTAGGGSATESGIIRLGTAGTHTDTYVAGNLTLVSDRNAKERFTPVNAREVLDKVARLPITEWQYKAQAKPQSESRHIGPMAQDFHAAFSLGSDDKHIGVVDFSGVALAAIQGLNEKLEERLARKDTEMGELKTENQALTERLNALEKKLGLGGAQADGKKQ